MSDLQKQNASSTTVPRGQQPALDELKRGRICGMIAMGSSRREAARLVGCHVSTITRTIARDADFAQAIVEAEMLSRNRPLRTMFEAAEKHWRAAAWLLERTRPEEFTRKRPHTYTHRDVRELVDRLLEEVLAKISLESDQQEVILTADRLIEELDNPPPPPPTAPTAPVNLELQMEKMKDEVEAYRQERQQKKDDEARRKAEQRRAEREAEQAREQPAASKA